MLTIFKFVVLSVFVIGSSAQAAGCPTELTPALIKSWGNPISQIHGYQMFQPENQKMLGKNVPYVIVNDDADEVWYRLSGEKRLSGDTLSSGIVAEFLRTYTGGSCRESKMSCSEYVDNNTPLEFVELMDEDEPGSGWNETASKLLAPSHPESRGVYIICRFHH